MTGYLFPANGISEVSRYDDVGMQGRLVPYTSDHLQLIHSITLRTYEHKSLFSEILKFGFVLFSMANKINLIICYQYCITYKHFKMEKKHNTVH